MKKKISLVLSIIVVVIAAFLGVAVWQYHRYVDIETIYPGVSIENIDVGGMTVEEAKQAVEDYEEKVAGRKVTLCVEDKTKSFPLSRLGLHCDGGQAAEAAYEAGRKGNFFQRIFEINEISGGKEIPLHFQVDRTDTLKIIRKKGRSFETEKKDAVLFREDGSFHIEKEENGISIDFKKDAEKLAEQIESPHWNREDISYHMTCQVDEAEHTKKELQQVKDILGTFTTSYAGSSEGRCKNVENGAGLLDGTLLYPGEILSVYETVSPFTYDNGYRLAGAYENGRTIQSYGGGICQVSTTLYNAVLRAELEVIERQNHSMIVHYVELSEDAAISGTEKDFKFKNNLDTPVYIEGKAGDNSITFTIYGKEYRDAGRSIEFVSERISTRPPGEKTVKDKTLEAGKKVVDQAGVTGYTAKLWKVIYENGTETDRVQINSSSYMSVPRIVRTGVKKKAEPKQDPGSKKQKKNKKKQEKKKQKKKKQEKKKQEKK